MIKLDHKRIAIGIAPIGWTNDDLPALGGENTFEQCISEMALAGYKGCEIGNKYPRDVAILKHKLALRNLQVVNAWFSTFFTTAPATQTISNFIKHRDFLHELGSKVIGVSEQGLSIQGERSRSIFNSKPVFSKHQWQLLANGLEQLALLCEEKGMKLAFHHHMGTGVQTESEIDKLMAMTSPRVHLLIDTGHLYFATNSQVALERIAEKYMARTTHIHLKDVRLDVLAKCRASDSSFLDAILKGVFTVPGDGIINYDPFFKIVKQANYHGWLLVEAEQDPFLANPFEYALKARHFIRLKTGI